MVRSFGLQLAVPCGRRIDDLRRDRLIGCNG